MKLIIRNILVIALIVVVGVILVFKFLNLYTLSNEHVIVPNLIGKSVDEIPEVEHLNFKISDSIYNKNFQRGVIVNQFPGPNSEVKPNRTVSITYNRKTPKLIAVPNVIDQSVKLSIQSIKNAGFIIGKIDTIENKFPIIISMSREGQFLNGGEQLQEGSTIDITIGKEN